MVKNKRGITLIALVVTIVVLLILAGVTISLLLDENGIIAKSKDARTETRVSQIEDEVGMWKQHNFINKESNQAQESADTMLASLISRKLLTEDEIDREQELITIKKKDGTVIKEISYSSVTINISKFPETEKSGAVLLTVDSVEGMTIPNFYIYNRDWSEVEAYLKTINKEQKKEMIREMLPKLANKEFETDECDTLEKALNKIALEIEGYGILDTEEKLWNCLDKENLYEGFLLEFGIGPLYTKEVNETTDIIEGYTVTNPDGETSNTYGVIENGTYTFKVKDNLTGKTYTKKVEVTNIDKTLPQYIITDKEGIGILDIIANKYTTFEKAYIIYNNEKIDITSLIWDRDDNGEYRIFPYGGSGISDFLAKKHIINSRTKLSNTNQTIILVKDGIEYTGVFNMGEIEEVN